MNKHLEENKDLFKFSIETDCFLTLYLSGRLFLRTSRGLLAEYSCSHFFTPSRGSAALWEVGAYLKVRRRPHSVHLALEQASIPRTFATASAFLPATERMSLWLHWESTTFCEKYHWGHKASLVGLTCCLGIPLTLHRALYKGAATPMADTFLSHEAGRPPSQPQLTSRRLRWN